MNWRWPSDLPILVFVGIIILTLKLQLIMHHHINKSASFSKKRKLIDVIALFWFPLTKVFRNRRILSLSNFLFSPVLLGKNKEENQNAWSKVKCDSLLFKKDDVFITLTFTSVHLNSHVPLSVPLFGPKPNKACSDVLLQIVLCDCVGAKATLEHLQWQILSHITSINWGINHWFNPDYTSLRPRPNVELFMRRIKLYFGST